MFEGVTEREKNTCHRKEHLKRDQVTVEHIQQKKKLDRKCRHHLKSRLHVEPYGPIETKDQHQRSVTSAHCHMISEDTHW